MSKMFFQIASEHLNFVFWTTFYKTGPKPFIISESLPMKIFEIFQILSFLTFSYYCTNLEFQNTFKKLTFKGVC